VSQSWTNDLYQWTGYANGTQSYSAYDLLGRRTQASFADASHTGPKCGMRRPIQSA